jgi:hypothetical protein
MAELHPVSDFNHPCPVMRMNIACELGVFTNCFSGDVTAEPLMPHLGGSFGGINILIPFCHYVS